MKNKFLALVLVGAFVFQSPAAIPPAGKILPEDTLFMFTMPDVDKISDFRKGSPELQFWNDPAMKPFKEKFTGKFKESVITPLERELGIRLEDYTTLPHGQFTFAI